MFRIPTDSVWYTDPRGWLLKCFETINWAQAYDFLEFVTTRADRFFKMSVPEAIEQANRMLEREHSGYRFVGGELTPITNVTEIAEVEGAIQRTSGSALDGASEHLKTALGLFGKRPVPDHRNAIKEAISAVEGVVKLINGTRGGGLNAALEAVSARIELHPALKAGLERLYGYTSDEDGIRHPILDEPNVDEADARYMIVTCSAFVNFLIVKAEAAGLLKGR